MATSAAPTHIRAYMVSRELIIRRFLQDIEVDSSPLQSEIPSQPANPTLSEEAAFQKKAKEFKFQWVAYVDRSTPQPERTPRILPRYRPKRPPQWSEETWDNRFVIGNDDFHVFTERPDTKSDPTCFFALKVSRDKGCDGRWMYEDFDDDPGSLRRLRDFLENIFTPSATVHD